MADQALNIQPVVDWLDNGAPPARLPQEVLLHLCRRLVASGISLYRVAVFVRTLHPNVAGRGFFWREGGEEVEVHLAEHDFIGSDEHLASRIADPGCAMDYPVLADLRSEGVTDYLAAPLRFINGEVHVASFATRQPGGFGETDLTGLRRVLPALTRIAEIYGLRRMARNILDAYLGQQAGEKVLAGRIKRGDGEDLNAVIWFCDLRDSTPLADSMSRQDFLRLLNEYFECVLGPVLERQGEVLRFIGDAALAIFPVGERPAEACAKALAAARDALARMDKLNKNRQRPLRCGIGLHLGELTYGNIGTPARIEALCKALEVDLLVSERVAQQLPDGLRSLGKHTLRGVGDKMELFTLP